MLFNLALGFIAVVIAIFIWKIRRDLKKLNYIKSKLSANTPNISKRALEAVSRWIFFQPEVDRRIENYCSVIEQFPTMPFDIAIYISREMHDKEDVKNYKCLQPLTGKVESFYLYRSYQLIKDIAGDIQMPSEFLDKLSVLTHFNWGVRSITQCETEIVAVLFRRNENMTLSISTLDDNHNYKPGEQQC